MKANTYTSLEEYEKALIEKARAEAQENWKEVENKQRLLNLHKDVGYASTKALIAALQAAAGIKARKAAKAEKAPKAPKAKKEKAAGKKKRVKITPEIIAQVKAMKEAGKGPTEVSKALGISVPSFYNIIKK